MKIISFVQYTYFNFYVDIPARVEMICQIFLEEYSRL